MRHRPLILSAAIGALFLQAGSATADERERVQYRAPVPEQIYGSQLMTDEERRAYHVRIQSATTAEEREQIRREHHARMKDRAKARGIDLPDNPPAAAGPMGPGGMMGPGAGMGPGAMRRNESSSRR